MQLVPVKKRENLTKAAPRDPRSIRTRRALRDALAAEIVITGDLGKVTVTAVSDRASVTRRTFYSHFRDIPDLVCQVEDEILREIKPLLQQIAAIHLDELAVAIDMQKACPGSAELLEYFKERVVYIAPLLGDGGDPGFLQRLQILVRDVVEDRAKNGLDLREIGTFFDYYLTFAISAEVGVFVRWLTHGACEDATTMARMMTGLMFVRPGDLYGVQIKFDVPAFGQALIAELLASPSSSGRTDCD